jgi:hypothetical protein
MSGEVLELMRALADADLRAAAWCASQCARTVLPLVPEGEARPRLALEAAERWARGEETPEAVLRAAETVRDGVAGGRPAYFACSPGKRFDRYGRDFEWVGIDPIEPIGPAAVHAATATANNHANTTSVPQTDRWRRAYDETLERLEALVRAQRWPRLVPTPEQIHAAPPAVQVAWDAVCGSAEDLTVPELVEAWARAGRLELAWSEPVARAVAERTSEEAWVRRLLGRERSSKS